ncbi:diguanylate cyclase [Vibrio kagoshimensis]|uniref:sensor domain-containing diguanylate cyclase n=1 Tax=Vibrio kagoshimensis TaxID=2910244 RepID=UPI003D20A8C3
MKKFKSRTFIPVKSLTHIVAWLLFAMVVAVASCLLFFLNSLDQITTDELDQRVHLAQKLEANHGRDILEEYTYWDETYLKVVIESDANWIENNSGNYLMEKSDHDFSVGVIEGDKEAYFIKGVDAQNLSFDEIKNSLFELMNLAQQHNTETQLAHGLFRFNSDVYHIVGGPLIDERLKSPRQGTFLALGRRIDTEYLSELEKNYQLFDLKLSYSPKGLKYFTALLAPSGNAIAYLSWKPQLPSRDIIPVIILISILFTFIITSVMKILLQKEQASREEYEDKLFLEATTDSLTKVNNRRYFMEIGSRELNAYKRLDEGLFTVLVLDIDHFKAINDQHGHSVGDKALTHFAQLCLKELRESDIFGRIGGEEFAVVLPNTNLEKAIEVANRIRALVAQTPFVSKDKPLHLTVSIGVSVLTKQDQLEVLIEKADKALYDAKNEGRNRVVIYS